ncbi:serine/threonine-protein kinase [Actinoplanes sp. DH11]|uniref:serine/threonine-protein kinase n=1 Tax=Actinoplanes sp. DH11 TaxID=2857011 RepID=UPI001E53FE3B|nr:serine/threonine-protein kinase [Actinoplanes sp. DH11]
MTGTDLVGGRYRLLELIGSGGMGQVWQARDELLQRTVAVKETALPANGQTMREARAAARLEHPGVVKVYDVVEYDHRSWIVMEYVDSRSLHRAVRDDGPLPPREVARIGLHVLAALRAAHTAGVLHRDVKPDNVLLARDGRVVLGDFGLATIGAAAPGHDGGPDPRLGSPHYIAPERLLSQDSGVPADLWSLGATLYAAVEGRAPFARTGPESALRALLSDAPGVPELAGPLSPLLLDLLEKDPARRPSSAEVERRLRAVLAGDGRFRGRAQVAVPRTRSRSRLSPLAVAALLALAAGGAGVAAAARFGLQPPVAAASRPSPPASLSEPSLSEPPLSRPSPLVRVPAAQPPVLPAALCGSGTGSVTGPVVAATGNVPPGLPGGWVWFRDPAGFALSLPAGWQRSTSGNVVCFTDPRGHRAFTVNIAAVVTREPLAYWQRREKAERADGRLPGYSRISMGVLLLGRGGADWEYTWRSDSDTTRHDRRVLIAVTDRSSYLLRFSTTDADWPASVRSQRQLVDLFGSAR